MKCIWIGCILFLLVGESSGMSGTKSLITPTGRRDVGPKTRNKIFGSALTALVASEYRFVRQSEITEADEITEVEREYR